MKWAAIIGLIFLTGCAAIENAAFNIDRAFKTRSQQVDMYGVRCSGYGLPKGSIEHAQCVEDHMKRGANR